MKPVRILVPPGIGDGYWVLVKLRGWLARCGITSRPTIYAQDANPRRSARMWERVPFVNWGGYAKLPGMKTAAGLATIHRAYRIAGFPVQRGAFGFDYFISLNGSLDHGYPMDQALPGPTNWFEPFSDMGATEAHALTFRERFGDYVAVGCWDHGFYRHWLARFPLPRLLDTLRIVADTRTVVLMGAPWDRGGLADRLAAMDARFVNTVGATDFDQLTGLLAGASAVFGFPAGNTMLGPRFGTPTVLLWCDHFPKPFWTNACPPNPALYRAVDAKGAVPEALAAQLDHMVAA